MRWAVFIFLAVCVRSIWAAPAVLVSTAPLHALVARVMSEVAEPALLLPASSSPHTLALKPSQAALLQQADVVFWVGPGLEPFLQRPLDNRTAPSYALAQTPNLQRHAVRDHQWQKEEKTPEATHNSAHAHVGDDPHLWLNPDNAALLGAEVANLLSQLDPENQARYHANAQALEAELMQLSQELDETLAPYHDRPFIVYHDAYQYFERRFAMTSVAAVTAHPELPLSAQRMRRLQSALKTQEIQCLFVEPQLDDRIARQLVADLPVQVAKLDPLGVALTPGPDLYPALLRALAQNLTHCLSDSDDAVG